MKKHKKNHKKKHRNKKKGHRNNSSGGAALAGAPPRSRSARMPRLPPRAVPPDWRTMAAAAAGGVGGALVSGLIVNQKILLPETVSLVMTGMGGLGAYLTDGNARVAFTGAAAAGAGQLALAVLGKAALKNEEKRAQEAAPPTATTPASSQRPAGSPEPPPRQRATGGGVVVDLFQRASDDLDGYDEDAWRYRRDGTDDDDDDEPIEIDLDEAA